MLTEKEKADRVVQGLLEHIVHTQPDVHQTWTIAAARIFLGHKQLPCGRHEFENETNPKGRLAMCEGGRLVVRGNGIDSHTNGTMFISAKPCPTCAPNPRFANALHTDLGLQATVEEPRDA